MIGRVKAGFGASHHAGKPTQPGFIDPAVQVGQLKVALQPLGIGHRIEVAEIRLARAPDGFNDFRTARLHGRGVTGHFIQKAPGAGERVVQFMDVRAQVRAARHNVPAVRGNERLLY